MLLWHSNRRNDGHSGWHETVLDGDGAWAGVAVAYFGIDINLSALLADVGIMHKDAAASHLVLLNSISDGYLVFGDEPDVAVDATVVGEVECHLFLAWGVSLVVAVVGLDGDNYIVAYIIGRQGDGDGQVATLVFLHFLAVDVDGLLAHDGLEMQGDVATGTFLGQYEMLTIPSYALIVATTAGLGGHQLDAMGRAHHFPCLVVEVFCLSTSDIAQMKAPASIEVPYQASAVLQREEASYGGLRPCVYTAEDADDTNYLSHHITNYLF